MTAHGNSLNQAARHVAEWFHQMWANGQTGPSHSSDLRGQVVLITGASRGLGLILAGQFAAEGCKVAICARDAEELERARFRLTQEDAEVYAQSCDVSDREAVDRLVQAVTAHYGQIDILVNNAGIIQMGPLADLAIEDFERAMQVMFWGVLYGTMAVLPQMRARQSGRIVTITSIGGKLSAPHLLPYSTAKFAAVGLSQGLHAELAKEGISVTTIVPGFMRTGSQVNADFTGHQKREYTWFALGASLPGISMDAERAAQQIVQATKHRETERILSMPATVAVRFHGLFPGITANVLAIVNRVLPGPAGERVTIPGGAVESTMNSRVFTMLTTLGRAASRRFGEVKDR